MGDGTLSVQEVQKCSRLHQTMMTNLVSHTLFFQLLLRLVSPDTGAGPDGTLLIDPKRGTLSWF